MGASILFCVEHRVERDGHVTRGRIIHPEDLPENRPEDPQNLPGNLPEDLLLLLLPELANLPELACFGRGRPPPGGARARLLACFGRGRPPPDFKFTICVQAKKQNENKKK